MKLMILNMVKGWITKELLISVFGDLVREVLFDVVDDFVEKSENEYDDKVWEVLKRHINEYLDK